MSLRDPNVVNPARRKRVANVEEDFADNAVWITGQQNFSGEETARAIVAALGE